MCADERPADARAQAVKYFHLFSAYYMVVEDWAYAAATVFDARDCERAGDATMLAEYLGVLAHSEKAGTISKEEATRLAVDWWQVDAETRAIWADRLVFPDSRTKPAVRAWISGSPELRWFFENALVMAAKTLLDTYLDQVLRLLYLFDANRVVFADSSIRISAQDRRELEAISERVVSEETTRQLKELTSGSVSIRLGRIGEKAGVRINLDRHTREALQQLTYTRNQWVHSWEQGSPGLLSGLIVMHRRVHDSGDKPTSYPDIKFADAYRVCAAVARTVHDNVWCSVFPSETLAFLAGSLEQVYGVPSEFTLDVWADPFMSSGAA